MSNFNKYKFDELYVMSSGISSKPIQAGHGAPFVSFSTVFNNYFLPDRLVDLMDSSVKEQEIYSVKKGDLLLTRTSETIGELGMSCVAIKDYPKATFSGFVKRLRPLQSDKTYDKYMGFYLRSKSFRKIITNNAIMTLRASLNEKIFSYLNLYLPDFETQKNIGDFLYLLNSKIELNNRINAELESMAKTLYDYWFVQFDFPNEKGKPYKTSGGKMVWNVELKREIPEGWEDGNFGKYANLKGGFAFKSSWWTEKGLPVIKIKDINENYTLSIENCSCVNSDKYDKAKNYEAFPGDVVIAMTGATVGKYGIVPKTNTSILVNQRVGLFNLGKNPMLKLPFLINSLNQDYFRETVFVIASGAAQPNISSDQIDAIPLVIPEKMIVDLFNSKLSSFYETIINNIQENQKLSSLRDWLLPMLMNGQVRVG